MKIVLRDELQSSVETFSSLTFVFGSKIIRFSELHLPSTLFCFRVIFQRLSFFLKNHFECLNYEVDFLKYLGIPGRQ